MKSVLFWMLRHLVIPAGFMFATGIPQQFYKASKNPQKDPMMTFSTEEFKTLEITPLNQRTYLDSLFQLRKEMVKQNKYTSFLYFHDLKQLRMYEQFCRGSFEKTTQDRFAFMDFNFKQNELCNINLDQWRKTRTLPRNEQDIDKARDYWFPAGKKARENAVEMSFYGVLISFANWLFHVYLRGLPFAFILFLIWKLRMKKEFEEEFRWIQEKPQMYFGGAPLSFIISVIVWPFILGIDIRNRFNEVLKKADVLARRNSMFTFFSKQEQQLFEIGKKMSRQEFRDHLDAIGITQKHSFLLALTVTLFLLIIPRSVFPAVDTHHEKQTIVTSIDYGIDHNDSVVSYDYLPQAVIPDFLCVPSSERMCFTFYFPYRIGEILSGFLADIGGVPKVIFNFAKN